MMNEDPKFETRVMDVDLDHICREYAQKVLRDWEGALIQDIFVDNGKRRVVFHWLVDADLEEGNGS